MDGDPGSHQDKSDVSDRASIEENPCEIKTKRSRQFSLRQADDAAGHPTSGAVLLEQGLAKTHSRYFGIGESEVNRFRIVRLHLQQKGRDQDEQGCAQDQFLIQCHFRNKESVLHAFCPGKPPGFELLSEVITFRPSQVWRPGVLSGTPIGRQSLQ